MFSYLRAGSAASRMTPADLPARLVERARFVHASGISLAISASACDTVLAAFEAARAGGAKVSFDSNLRLKLWPLARAKAMIATAAGMADYFFPSIEDARALTGIENADALVDWAHGLGARHVFLKLGPEGVIVSDGARRERLAGHRVDAVDATGAGDCFAGSALARIALATTGFGAVAPLPRPDMVRAQLAAAP